MYGGRLRGGGKSNRPGAVRTGYRSDSSGMLYAFPIQRSSGSGVVTLRLPRSERPRNAKIFSPPRRCPPYTDVARPGSFSVFRHRKIQMFTNTSIHSQMKYCPRIHLESSYLIKQMTSTITLTKCLHIKHLLYSRKKIFRNEQLKKQPPNSTRNI